jgi:hypothetical protein
MQASALQYAFSRCPQRLMLSSLSLPAAGPNWSASVVDILAAAMPAARLRLCSVTRACLDLVGLTGSFTMLATGAGPCISRGAMDVADMVEVAVEVS